MEGLDKLLGYLHSDKSRVAFLNRVYTPGNVAVADRLMGLNPNRPLLENELNYAEKQGNTARRTQLTKRLVDYYVKEGQSTLLENKVILEDREIFDYAIDRLEETGREDALTHASEIAQFFGQEQKARHLLERVLALQMEMKDEYAFAPAETCVKLGRFNEAIDLFMQSGYHWFGDALNIAKTHASARVKEVAQRGFDEYAPDFHTQEKFVECSEILGKIDEAKKTLVREAESLEPDKPARFYQGLTSSLVELGLNNEARMVVEKVAAYQLQKARKRINDSTSLSFHDDQEELARLYETIGELSPVRSILLARIDAGLANGWHTSHYEKDIKRGFQLTGDRNFLERKLLLLEREEKYDEASKLANELGNRALAKAYRTMHQMVTAMPLTEE